MNKVYLTVLCLLMSIGFGLYSEIARAECSAEDISSYVQSGTTAEQLSQLCGQHSDGGYYPAYASVCATQWGVCQLVQQLPEGSACICSNQAGQFPGVAQ